MALISTIAELNENVTVSVRLEEEIILKYTEMAEEEVEDLIGSAFLVAIEENSIYAKIKKQLQRYVANIGTSKSLNALQAKIGQTGVKLTSAKETENVPWWLAKDLNRDLLKFGNQGLDRALKLISELDTVALDLPFMSEVNEYVPDMQTFQKEFNINNSWQTFNTLKPYIAESQFQIVDPVIKNCLDSLTDEMKKLIVKILVSASVARAAKAGGFVFSENALIVQWEQLPWEKHAVIQQDALMKLAEDRAQAATSYISELLSQLKTLDCYQAPTATNIISKKSGLYL